jgi:hypothetical protein
LESVTKGKYLPDGQTRALVQIAEYGVTVGCVHALAGDTQIIRLWAPYPATAAAELYAVRWLAVEQHFVAALLQPPVAELLMPSSARTPGAAG